MCGYSGKIRPKYYQGVINNEDESLQLGKYPTLSWSCDAFTNWLTQNAYNIGAGAVNTALGTVTQIGEANAIGAISTLSNGINSILGGIVGASMLPNTPQGNVNSGDVSFLFNINRFKIMHMRPKKEILQSIDDYFTKFGYKVNRVKIPNITGRKYWNYIEIGQGEELCHGNIPNNYMETINTIARRGVTIWHNHSHMGDFSLNNVII